MDEYLQADPYTCLVDLEDPEYQNFALKTVQIKSKGLYFEFDGANIPGIDYRLRELELAANMLVDRL